MINLYKSFDYDVFAATTLKDVIKIKEAWEKMAHHPAIDPDIIIAEIEENNKITPFILLVRKNNVIAGLLVATIRLIRNDFKLKYFKVFSSYATVLAVNDNGVIGVEDQKIAKLMIKGLKYFLMKNKIDYVHFACLSSDSEIRGALKAIFNRENILERDYEARWILRFPGSYNDFWMTKSSKTRNSIKRKEKKIVSKFPELKVEKFPPGSNYLKILEHIEVLIKKTYQYRLGITPLSQHEGINYWRRLSNLNRLAATVVTTKGIPVAFSWAHVYKSVALFGTPGYDPKYREYYIGEYCNLRLIELLAESSNTKIVDYGLGYSEYKKRLGTGYELQGHVLLFAETLKGLYLKMLIKSFNHINKSVTKIMENFGLKEKVKKIIRFR